MGWYDPDNPTKRDKLFSAIEKSKRQQYNGRRNRVDLIEDYAGGLYVESEYNTRQKVTLPLMWQAASTYTYNLAAGNPQCLISTNHVELQPFVEHYQQALNQLIRNIGLEGHLRQAVLDAFFGFGIMKTYTRDAGEYMLDIDFEVDPGEPYACRVSPDDIVWDQTARSLRNVGFIEHTYYLPKASLRKDERVNQKVLKKLDPVNRRHDDEGDKRADELSGTDFLQADYREMVKLREVWLPFDGMVYTYPDDPKSGVLWETEWEDQQQGPYHFLYFDEVPDNVHPVSPASQLQTMHEALNSIWEKLVKQCKRAKSNVTYTGASADDAKEYQKARDGEMFKANTPEELRVLTLEGPDAKIFGIGQDLYNRFDSAAGNLSMMAGLGPSSDTLGQDKMVEGNVSKHLAKMQETVLKFTEKIVRSLGKMLWNDKAKVIPGKIDVGGYSVDSTWTPDLRMGEVSDYDYEIIPYSLMPMSPSDRVRHLDSMLQQIIVPLMPMIQQQGGTPNFQEILRTRANLLNLPELERMIEWVGPPMVEPPASSQQLQSPVTERHNVRHNSGGQGMQEQSINQLMMSGNESGATQAA